MIFRHEKLKHRFFDQIKGVSASDPGGVAENDPGRQRDGFKKTKICQ